jgi:hypothetical protein
LATPSNSCELKSAADAIGMDESRGAANNIAIFDDDPVSEKG